MAGQLRQVAADRLRINFWSIEQEGVRAFLLVGEDSAVLVDTANGGNIKQVCEAITKNPIKLITTHADGDHLGGDEFFDEQYMHPVEFDRYETKNDKVLKAKPILEGEVIKVGEFELEVILVPGHTPGSIVLLDRKNKFLIAGDTLQAHAIFMFGDGRNLKAFKHSLQRLQKLADEGAFDTVYASHGVAELGTDIIAETLTLTEQVLAGEAAAVETEIPDWLKDKDFKIYGDGRVQMYV